MYNKQNAVRNWEGKQINRIFVCMLRVAAAVAISKMEFQEILRPEEYDMLQEILRPEEYDMLQEILRPEEYDML